ncbi:hypothetical protein AB0I39_25165 [Kitasatospora purpeofusca]|uniref:hypothetical protein n=1 Tax=Kitasatospora purpeofusca TaxID=67352 RepID=UPI00340AFF3C
MDEGGEPACWLDRVCEDCGRVRERPGPGPCENCGSGADGADRTDGADGADRTYRTNGRDNENPRADHRR